MSIFRKDEPKVLSILFEAGAWVIVILIILTAVAVAAVLVG